MKKNILLVGTLFLLSCGGATSSVVHQADAAGNQSDTVNSIKDAAFTSTDGNVAVDAGYASDGTTIAIPSGFTASQCKFTAAVANVDGTSISTYVSINTTTGEVTCQKLVQQRVELAPEEETCVASYTLLCVK